MSIEPTEEQRAAAATHVLGVCLPVIDWVRTGRVDDTDNLDACVDLARLLAEREAKLREEMERLHRAVVDTICDAQDAENDTLRARVAQAESALDIYVANDEKADELLKRAGFDDTVNVVPRLAALVDETVALRARVAELEVHANTAMDNRDAHKAYAIELEEREAQHLARIAELEAEFAEEKADICELHEKHHVEMSKAEESISVLRGAIQFALKCGNPREAKIELLEALDDTAHYDDAKAAEGGAQ